MHVQIIVFCIMGILFKDLKKCPVCSASRYKTNAGYSGDDNQVPSILADDATLGMFEKQSKIPAMVMWYLLVSYRLRRFFSNPMDAELMRWWNTDQRKKGDGKLQHPADAQQWKEFDDKYY